MVRAYIDFDSTLYDTDVIKKKIDHIIADEICKNVSNCDKQCVINEIKDAKSNGVKSVFGLSKYFEEKYHLEKNCIRAEFEKFLSKGDEILYPDSVKFLKKLAQKGYEINILTYTSQDSYDYQMLKIMGAKIFDLVDNIYMCTKSKGELSLDYENGYFFDDNPKELVSLFKAGVSPERLFRIRRIGAGYSDIEISEYKSNDYVGFEEIKV